MVSTLVVGNGFTVDPEFAKLCPPLTPEERNLLTASIEADGCRDALVIWQEEQLLLDGHNRHAICGQLGIDYRTTAISLPNREAAVEWVIANQLGRRNCTAEQRAYLQGKRYRHEQKQGNRTDRTSGQVDQKLNTAERIGKELGIGEATVRRDAKFSDAVDEIGKNVGKEAREEILSGRSPMSKEKITALAGKPAEEQVAAIAAAKDQSIKPSPALPTLIDEKLTKSEQEAKAVRDEFHGYIAKISDGGVYTVETIADATGIAKSSVHWFIRMCEVSPAVIVHRNFGRKGLTQYTFVKTECVDAAKRIRQLAEQIATDPASSSKSCAAAQRILSFLGG